jgi:DNA-binding transcriptional LysR family regulator
MHQADEMHVFARVVERASFSAAAEDLGTTPSAVSKAIARLEDRLGVRLLHRTTRRLSLTPEGTLYLRRAQQILAAIEDTEEEIAGRVSDARGLLRVSALVPFAAHYLAPAIPDFIARHPRVEIELKATDRVVDLLEEHVDLALRTGSIREGSLVARRIGEVERGIFAAPEYIERHGAPATPDDLKRHDCIRLSTPCGERWPFLRDGKVREVEIGGQIVADNAMVGLHLALAGAGIVRTSLLTAGPALRDGRLVPLLRACHVADPMPLSAVYPAGRHRMPKVRVFIDFLLERFGHAPWREGLDRAGEAEETLRPTARAVG